jgi:ATP-dependent helicase/nuclease subunit B
MSAPREGRPAPRLATIPPGEDFITVLAEAFASGVLFGRAPLSPQEMAASRIFVPTRRAADVLLATLAGMARPARLLPRVVPLGDEEALAEIALAAAGMGALVPDRPVMHALDRRLALLRLVEGWRDAVAGLHGPGGETEGFAVAAGRADAFALAGDLAALIDELAIEDVPLHRLAGADPPDFDPARHDTYWSLTRTFLKIAAEHWPKLLAERGLGDPSETSRDCLRALARAYAAHPPASPVVIAGSTGSVAATADLMAVVARLPLGAVVLPGLDQVLEDRSWALVGAVGSDLPTRYAHPQSVLKQTLDRMGAPREAVTRLPGPGPSAAERLSSEIARPAATTARWQEAPPDAALIDDAVRRLTLIEAADGHEEALAIALILRETLETPGKTAALVTPDRDLARAVIGELERWNIAAAATAAVPLAERPLAALARLALRVAAGGTAGDLHALLRHPLLSLGLAPAERDRAVDAIEIAGLRGRRLGAPATASLVHLLEVECTRVVEPRDPAPRRRLTSETLDAGLALARRLDSALADYAGALAGAPPLRSAAGALRRLVDVLIGTEGVDDPWAASEEGRAFAQLLDHLDSGEDAGPAVSGDDFAAIVEQLLAETPVRLWQSGHPRLKIWGLLEARLLTVDRLILGGLNEGHWPPDVRVDPFLNRAMRLALGLQPPERRVGQSAHDFAMALGGREVFLTRAGKLAGAPAIASRFLRRLKAYLGEETFRALAGKGRRYLDWTRALDRPDRVVAIERPAPKVPPELFLKRLSITEVETLYRDPYTLFARHVLGLDPLEAMGQPPDARLRGTVIHQVLAEFARRFPAALPEDADRQLEHLGREAFAAIAGADADTVAFWQRRFGAFVPWFIDWERKRRADLVRLHVECGGRLGLDLAGGHRLILSGRADRLEERTDLFGARAIAIIDYKTGKPPSGDQVLGGLAPQLPITAAMLRQGAFRDLDTSGEAALSLSYVKVAGAHGEGHHVTIVPKLEMLDSIIDRQFGALKTHLDEYLLGARGFTSQRLPEKRRSTGDYDGLARVLEWGLAGEGEEGEEP